ncbi:hypothetical protein P7K49_003057, partial [Saguinus oedipus]
MTWKPQHGLPELPALSRFPQLMRISSSALLQREKGMSLTPSSWGQWLMTAPERLAVPWARLVSFHCLLGAGGDSKAAHAETSGR